MDVLPTDAEVAIDHAGLSAGDAMPHRSNAAELLDVDVDAQPTHHAKRSRVAPISQRSTLASISAELLAAQFPMRKGARLIGVSLSSLCADAADVDTQMALAL